MFLNILGGKQVTRELLNLVSQQAGFGNEPHLSSRRLNRKDRDETKNITNTPKENNVDPLILIGYITCSKLLLFCLFLKSLPIVLLKRCWDVDCNFLRLGNI